MNPSPPNALLAGEKRSLLLFTLLAAILILIRLGTPYFWEDEAHTALLAKTILAHGVPKGTDGFHSFSVDPTGGNSDMTSDGTWILTPWLPYYLIAPLAGLPPEGTEWLLRLPFALFGVMTVPLTFFVARRFFGRETALVSLLFQPAIFFVILWA